MRIEMPTENAVQKIGARFCVYNCDSKGTVIGIAGKNITVVYDHDMATTHTMPKTDFAEITYAHHGK